MRVCGCLVIDTGSSEASSKAPSAEVKCLMALALGAAV